jgi:YVTN family beta-propeller protein
MNPHSRFSVHRLSNAAFVCLGAAAIALAAGSPFVGTANASPVTNQWNAKIGAGGANGSASIKISATGAGSLVVSLKGLAHSTIYSETISKGSCASASTKLLTLPALKTTSSGTAARTNTLTVAQATLVNRAGEVIRFVAGTHAFCGPFTKVATGPPVAPTPTPTPTPAPTPPATTAAIAATITVGEAPQGVAVTPLGVLVANWWDGTLTRIDPATNAVGAPLSLTITGNEGPQAVTSGEGAIWVAMQAYDSAGNNMIAGPVERLDATSGQVVATIPVGKGGFDITTSPGAVWVTNYMDDTVSRIDPATNLVTATISVGHRPFGIAYGLGAVWVANEKGPSVSRIDPASNQVVATILTVSGTEGVTVGAGSVWVTNYGHRGQSDGALLRIDPATNQIVTTISVGTNPGFVAFGGGYVWVALNGEPTIVQVNPATNAVAAKISPDTLVIGADGKIVTFWGIAATDHAVWATQPQPGDAFTNNVPPPGDLIRINY